MNKKNQMVTFKMGKETFGVPIQMVQEIVRVPEITMVPEMPSFVEGVMNLRGKIVSIIDVNKRLKIGCSSRSRTSRILVVEVDRKIIGLLVDAVTEILRLPSDAIEPAPDIVTAVGSEYITGVGKLPGKLIILLDLHKILRPDEIKRLAIEGQTQFTQSAVRRPVLDTAA